jgi:AbrB family looped-hinge helix DNA binding protein
MSITKVSEDYQVEIPHDVREQLGITPGMEFDVIVKHGHAHLVPLRPIKEMRGFAAGIDTTVDREADRY